MPLDERWNLTTKELVEELGRPLGPGVPGPPEGLLLDRMIDVRIADSDAEGSANLVASTDKLVSATHRLGTMTGWLVGGTLLLGVSAATDVILKLVRGAH
jgi:hypothetical protein